ncbi:hypothetical protein WMY93_020671 [Mugilogobius chulae]|uniref:Uncharacterized protein n=1 Tax=Mugilogobius chulae TaxID=88201 RepID=A0AAW0NKS8_9GOBI
MLSLNRRVFVRPCCFVLRRVPEIQSESPCLALPSRGRGIAARVWGAALYRALPFPRRHRTAGLGSRSLPGSASPTEASHRGSGEPLFTALCLSHGGSKHCSGITETSRTGAALCHGSERTCVDVTSSHGSLRAGPRSAQKRQQKMTRSFLQN